MKTVLALIFGAVAIFWVSAAQAENLHQKYGSYWDCGYITAGLPLYDSCKPCEDKGMEFFQDSDTTGHCVPKAGETESEVETPAVPKKPTPVKAKVQYTIRFCNDTGADKLYVSLGTHDQLGGVMWFTLRGWYSVDLGTCKNLAVREFGQYQQMVFAYHAQAGNRYWPTKVWPADKNWSVEEWLKQPPERINFCIDTRKRFERYTQTQTSCDAQQSRGFEILWIEREDDVKMVVKEVRVQ